MVRRGSFIGGQDNLSVPDAPTIGAATAGDESVSVAFTAPSAVGDDPITGYGASATDGTNVISGTGSSSPITISGLTNGTSYTAQVWAINDYGNGPLSAATSSFSPVSPVGLYMGGTDAGGSPFRDDVAKITITSTGDATDFGNLSATREAGQAFSSSTRAIYSGGNNSSNNLVNIIEYFTFASAGDATDFGDATGTVAYGNGLSNSTRGVYGVLYYDGSRSDVMEYVTIASTGDGTDFGNLSVSRTEGGAFASTTRGIFSGGSTGSSSNVIDYITIASTGNATDFGDTTAARYGVTGASNSTRGISAGGYTTGYSNIMDYVTIASTGNATDFGDHTQTVRHIVGCSSSHGGL